MPRRPAEFHYYDWSFQRWFGSQTRAKAKSLTQACLPDEIKELSPEAREFVLQAVRLAAMGAYRELLDYCYNDGDIPADLGGLASLCGCSPELFEAIWPTFKSKFHATKKADGKLVNDEVNVRRKVFLKRRKQKNSDTTENPEEKGRRKSSASNKIEQHSEPNRADSEHEVFISSKQEVLSNKQYAESNKGSTPNAIEDSGWFDFRQTAEAAGMSGSEPDWDEAWRFEWKRLDFTQQKQAFDGIRSRVGTEDPALTALPRNYLKRRMWERAVHGKQAVGKDRPRKEFRLEIPKEDPSNV